MQPSRSLKLVHTFAVLAALCAVGCYDTADAQPQLTVTPATTADQPLAFTNIPSGGISKPQTVTISTVDGTATTIILQVNPNSKWLVISPASSVNTPASLNVQADTANLTTGSYLGSFTASVSGAPGDFVTIYVALTVSGASALTANPPSLSFTAPVGAMTGTPASTQVQINSSANSLDYTVQAQTSDGHNWLLLNTVNGNTSGAPFTVSVNPNALTPTIFPAIYTGLIIVSSTTTSDAVLISVQLTVTPVAAVSVTPAVPSEFLWQIGTPDPPTEQIAISASGGTSSFTIQQNPPVSWLILSAQSGIAGSTPNFITLNVRPSGLGLTQGSYTTNLIITPAGEASLPPVPVTLVVAANPVIQLSTTSLSFSAPFAGAAPSSKSVTITASGGAAVPFSISSNASWLTFTSNGSTTPSTLTIRADPTGLAEQTYNGAITVSPTNGDPYFETINVSFSVTASSQLFAGPAALLFSYQTGQSPPQAQVVSLTSNGQIIPFTIATSTSNCGSNWLSAQSDSNTTNTTLTVSVVTTGIAPGTCSGLVVLNYDSGSGPASVGIQVTLAVSNSAVLAANMTPGFGIFNATLDSAPFQRLITLTSTDPTVNIPYTISVSSSGGPWLGVLGSTSGTTPQNLTVQITPTAVVLPGDYAGKIMIDSPSLGIEFTIPISLTVSTDTMVTVTPGSLSFTESQNGALPDAQNLTLSSTHGIATYTAGIASITGGNWLKVSPISGNANGAVQVSILQNSLSPGDYPAVISFGFQGAATFGANVQVVLHVLPPQVVNLSATNLKFLYQVGDPAPATQTLNVTSTSGPVTVNAKASSDAGWLSVTPSTGTTPQAITVTVNPTGLTANTYSGSVTISSPGVLANPITVPVSFTVSPAPAPQPVFIINNATGVAGRIAPGEELAIKGTLLGPADGVLFSVDPTTGKVPTTLAGVRVTFDTIPGIPIYVSATQINVIVPYEINGRTSTSMVVSYLGQNSATFPLAVDSASPGLFTDDFSGSGQVAAINQDGSINGSTGGFSAVPRGRVISLYGTGGGQTNPISITGSVTKIPASVSDLYLIATTTATVDGIPAQVTFAGAAPGLVSGVIQVNVIVPPGVTPRSSVPVSINVGGISSPAGTTIAVQ